MASYSAKQHSTLLKTFDQKMDEMEKDRSKELIFNILLPFQRMNNEIYGLTSQYPEFIENEPSSIFLTQLNLFNENIMRILNNEPLTFPQNSSSTTQSSSANHTAAESTTQSNTSASTSTNGDNEMGLHELIDFLVLTDIRPIEYNKDLLITLLIDKEITNQNILEHKSEMISILEDCQFPPQRAKFTMEQIERNLVKTHDKKESNPQNNAIVKQEHSEQQAVNDDKPESECVKDEDLNGVKVIDLTLMAIEALFEGQMNINRSQIERLYKENEIDTFKISNMTEMEFGSILTKCKSSSNGYTSFSKPQCTKIHRAIKSLLNIKTKYRFDIDIGLAVIYLINEDNFFMQRDITIKPDKIMAAFKPYSANDFHEMGKKQFIKILQTQTHIKMGHGTKLWNTIKAFIEDSNVKVPPQIIIAVEDHEDHEDRQNHESDIAQKHEGP